MKLDALVRRAPGTTQLLDWLETAVGQDAESVHESNVVEFLVFASMGNEKRVK